AIDQFEDRSAYLEAVEDQIDPYQTAIAPAQQTLWQSLLDAADDAAVEQATQDNELQHTQFQTNVTYAIHVQEASANQLSASNSALQGFQQGQAAAQWNYQFAVAAADATLQNTMQTAQATHDQLVAQFRDDNNATQAAQLTILQNSMAGFYAN